VNTKIQKWGNSLGMRIPGHLAKEAGVQEGTGVDIRVVRGRLVISVLRRTKYSLAELVAGITPGNRNSTLLDGKPRGKELL